MFMAAGYAAYEGGRTLKQNVERRKNPTLEGDFIVASADPAKNQRRSLRTSVQEVKQSLTQTSDHVRRSLSRLASSRSNNRSFQQGEGEDDEGTTAVVYNVGQEVTLKNMEDINLNGMEALVLQDFGSKGVMVQFLDKKEGYDNYHESGILLKPNNICAPGEINSVQIMVGSLIELQNLGALHMNGLRGMVMEPPKDIKEGRVAVQLLEGSADLVSVKPENCRMIETIGSNTSS